MDEYRGWVVRIRWGGGVDAENRGGGGGVDAGEECSARSYGINYPKATKTHFRKIKTSAVGV